MLSTTGHLDRPPSPVTAYLGLGSNLGDRKDHLKRAVAVLRRQAEEITVKRVSPIYSTEHVGFSAQDSGDTPEYLNCVAKIETSLSAWELLLAIRSIEAAGGRVRSGHWAPRTIDIDVLIYDNLVVDEPNLTLPHPRMSTRLFVLAPLSDIDPGLRLMNGKSVLEMLENAELSSQKIRRFEVDL